MSAKLETVVLDSEGLSGWIAQDRKLLAMLHVFHDMGADLVVGANTIVEVSHAKVNRPRLSGALSRVKVEPVTERRPRRRRNCSGQQDCTATSTPSTLPLQRLRSANPGRSPCSRPMSTT